MADMLKIEIDCEDDGRWLGEVLALPRVPDVRPRAA
jgi:hypothetical protein